MDMHVPAPAEALPWFQRKVASTESLYLDWDFRNLVHGVEIPAQVQQLHLLGLLAAAHGLESPRRLRALYLELKHKHRKYHYLEPQVVELCCISRLETLALVSVDLSCIRSEQLLALERLKHLQLIDT